MGAVAALATAVLVLATGGQWASADGPPVLVPDVAVARPGASVLVGLQGWPVGGAVTVVLCGNDGLRGSEDCDQIGGQSIEIRNPTVEYVKLRVALPPAPCPCILRANDVSSDVVITTPFDVMGAATAPPVGRDGTPPAPIAVTARLQDVRPSLVGRLRRAFGGPSKRTLEVAVRNVSGTPLSGVLVSANFGRHAGGGEALDAPPAMDLAPGEARTVSLPVDFQPPVHGGYQISGSVFAGGRPVAFRTSMTATPWGLVFVAIVVLADLGVMVAVSVVGRRRDRWSDDAEQDPGDGPDAAAIWAPDEPEMAAANA